MNTKAGILLGAALVTLILIAGWYFLNQRNSQAVTQVSISTDKQEYSIGNTIYIRIQNLGNHPIHIYCLERPCALSNFPATVERFVDGQWQDFGGLCVRSGLSLEQAMSIEGDYIRHTLSAKSSFELAVSTLLLEPEERLRVVYYLGSWKKPIHSNEFIVKP